MGAPTKFWNIPDDELIDMLDKNLISDEDLREYARELIIRLENTTE